MWKLATILICWFALQKDSEPEKIVISKQVFTVEGSTSVGCFSCTYKALRNDTLYANVSPSESHSIKYTIPSDGFRCGNFLLNRDFRKTIKANKYKEINVEISNVKRKEEYYFCDVKVQLAGKDKTYRNVILKADSKKLLGCLVIHFSEFELTAPRKMGGLIKIKEEITIVIDLSLT